MNISGIRDTNRVDGASTYSIAVARKSLDAQQQEGKNAVALIQASAAPPLKPGHTLSIVI